ncbi:calycin-like domain-containing protein [Leyella stercorea]|uniref:calycin-like domain-containing protein n=1 Tax=Leyella stercorea TaxID=363265 RepID=UPI00266F4700|nr:calycin-like domain-containing protein [Leyella stercorea]
MKKILSLLSMLMITVMAFATDYKGQLDYILTTRNGDLTGPSYAQGTLKIEPYAGGKYTVTATGCDLSSIDKDLGNWDEIICEGVEGTTDANGVTTINVAPYAFRGSDNAELKNAKLFVKFKGDKAYATFEGTYNPNFYANYKLKYTFGVDEGFDGGGSTGGGETGGETSSIVTVKENFQSTEGSSWGENVTIDWSTQKLVVSVNLASTGSDKGFLGVTKKGQTAGWNKYGIIFYNTNGSTVQGYAPGQPNNANTDQVTKGEDPVRFEISKDGGVKCQGNVVISASNIAHLTNQSEIVVGAADKPAGALYNYIKVVPLDWSEVPPVTVKETKEFKNVAYTTSMGGSGTATVTFTEMSDGTFPMTFASDGLNVKAENLTKATDAKGRTTYTGTAKRTDADVTFTVKAIVYGEAAAQKLYMTMDNGAGFVVTVGEDPDYVAPVTYKNTLKVVRGTDTKTYENAEVSVLAKGENKYAVTIPSFTDMDQMEGTIGKLTFEATGVEDGGTLKLTATSAATTQEGGTGWEAAAFTASMDATVTGETLAGTFTVVYPNDATNYTYTLYYGVEPPVAPEEPKDVTVVEKYQADGTGFSHTINVDWDKQKIVASIDFSNGGDDKDILAMTTGDSFAAFQTSTYRTMHWYCNQTAKQMSGFFAKDGAGNNNTGRMDVADCLAKFEISKAEGLKVNGEVKMTPEVLEELLTGDPIIIGSGESPKFSQAYYNYIKVVSLDWKEPTEPEVKEEKTFNEALYMGGSKAADAKVVVKEMSDNTVNMSLQFSGYEYTSTELTKGTDSKDRTTYTGKVAKDTQTYDVAGVVYEKDNVERLYMTMITGVTTVIVGENPDAVTPDPGVTEESNKTYTSNLRILDGETTVVEEAEADVNIIKYSDESYKVTLKNVNMLNKTQDLVFVGKALIEEAPTEATEPLTIIAKSDAATTEFFGEEMSATFEITEVSAEEIKMGFVLNNTSLEYQGEFNYTEEETPEVYTSNLHIYDAAAPEIDLFQADQAKVEFLATATGGFKLTLKDVTLNEKTQDLVFTGALPTPQPGGQDPLAEEGETTPAEPAMVLNATADEATATFLGATSATAVFNVIMNDEAETENDAFALTFTITAGEKTLGGEFNYEKQDTPDEKYPVSFDKTALNTSAHGRMLNSFSLQQAGKEKQTKSVKTSKAAYEDHTADEPFTVEAGSELTASFDYTGEWMHSFVYIDFDNDGQFSYKEGQWDQTGTDLVAFSFYSLDSNPKNDASGYNSVGDELTGDARNTYVAPSFKAPAKAGEYRIRFKFDWNCILPGGSSSILSDGGGVWDATLKVVEPVVDGISSINAEVANGETQLFTVNGVKLNKLQKGLNIVRTADGKVKKVLVK